MRRVASLLVLLSIAVAGCGGGSSRSVSEAQTRLRTQPPSKAAFISQADAICHNHASRREDLESQANELGPLDSQKAHHVADLLREGSDNLMAEAQELQALQTPFPGAGTLRSLVSIVGAEARLIDDWAGAYNALDAAKIRRLQLRIGVVNAKAERVAHGYGFQVCGRA